MPMGTLTLKQVAEVLQLTPRTVYSYLRSGLLPGAKVGKQWRVLEDDLTESIRSGNKINA
jgi:excisionase family DNA binding protein